VAATQSNEELHVRTMSKSKREIGKSGSESTGRVTAKDVAAKLIADIEAGSRHIEDIVVRAEEVIRESCGCVAEEPVRVPVDKELSSSSTTRNVALTGSSS